MCRFHSSVFASCSEMPAGAVTISAVGRIRASAGRSGECRPRKKSFTPISPRKTPLAVPSLVTAATSVSAARRSADTSPSGVPGRTFSSLRRNPALFLLTLRTSSACCPVGWFWWMNPIPPACASAIASRGDDTASMIALHNGSATRNGACPPTGCRTSGADRLTFAGVQS